MIRLTFWFSIVAGVAAGMCMTALAEGGAIAGDAEAAKHALEASTVRIVDRLDRPGLVFRQFDLSVLSHYSYLVGGDGEAVVVDPARDVSAYMDEAAKAGLKITRIYLTHSHADFVAGHLELAARTGASILVNQKSNVGYAHEPVTDGTTFKVGQQVTCVVRETPGHTPDGTCLLVTTPGAAVDPEFVLTGDTLFIGSVGRPDLMGGTWSAAQLATMIWDTWQNVLSKVPNETKVYPAHGAGSLCGAHLSDANVSTFGEQKATNVYLQHKDKSTFIMAVLEGLPQAPQYFGMNVAMNKAGPPLVDWATEMPTGLDAAAVANAVGAGAWVLDIREAALFAQGNIPGAMNIPLRGRFETWTGIMLPWGKPLILVGTDEAIREARFRLHRIGFDAQAGYLIGGMAAWKAAGSAMNTVTLVSPAELYEQFQKGTAPVIVDVRLPTEWMALRIAKQLLNTPINTLASDCSKLDPAMPALTVCNSAYRSSMGASVLLRAGFRDVRNLAGGGEAWLAAGLPTYSTQAAGHDSAAAVFVDLPERLAAESLAQQLMDLPGSFELVDVRPTWQFDEYHVPGTVNATPAEVLGNPKYLVGKQPLVPLCRDGALSAAIGGALSPKTERAIRYLDGGVQTYWERLMKPAGIASETQPIRAPATPAEVHSAPPAASAPTPPSVPAPSAPQPKKRASAGC